MTSDNSEFAAALADLSRPDQFTPDDGIIVSLDQYKTLYRALLLADKVTREPSNAIYEAGCNELDTWIDPTDGGAVKAVFRAMIRAAEAEIQEEIAHAD